MADDPTRRESFDLDASTRKWKWAGLILMGLFFLAFPVFRLYEPTQRADAREAQSSFLAAEGAALFDTNCAECHGAAGSGAIAPALGSQEFLQSVDDDQIAQLTALGVPGTEMVAYSNDFGGPLTAQEINSITVFLRSLEEDARSIPNWRTPLDDDDLDGQELFLLACARCHGADAGGIEEVGAPDISQDSMTLMESDEWITGRITDGYKLMPRFGRILTAEQIQMLVVYMRYGEDVPVTTTSTTMPGTTPTTIISGETTTTTTTMGGTPATNDVLALGEKVFQETAGGYGCQECHGPDATGTPNGPNIIGASRSTISGGLNGGIPDMDFNPKLTNEEVEAVYEYLVWLQQQQLEDG